MGRLHALAFALLVALVVCFSFDTASSYSLEVYEAQKALKELGYDPGPVDGIWGKSTESVIKHFQVDKGLPVTGQLDEQTKKKLGIGSADRGIKAKPKSIQKRVALVIGNGGYKTDPLRNPANDAHDMAAMLKKLDFEVIRKINANKREMIIAIDKFGNKLRSADVGLFFFAGHGMQVKDQNYLIPVGSYVSSETDVEYEGVAAGRVLGKMETAGSKINIVILDACRDNPFKRSFRSASRGLARMVAPKGSFIAYATAPGSVAADGKGRNGIFTKHILRNIGEENTPIEKIFKNVRKGVLTETEDKQMPWQSSSLTGDFYFKARNLNLIERLPQETSKPPEPSANKELIFWQSVQNSNDISLLEEYIKLFPNGTFVSIAKRKIELIKKIMKEELIKAEREFKLAEKEFKRYEKVYKSGALSHHDFEKILNKYNEAKERLKKLKTESYYHSNQNKGVDKKLAANIPLKEIGRDGRFIAYENGTVQDTKTGLMWAAKDNGRDVTWQEAKAFCENYRGGDYSDWRMPTKDELAGLYDKNKSYQAKQYSSYDVHLTELIQLTVGAPWTSMTRGSNAVRFYFQYGFKGWSPRLYSRYGRALPVRSIN